MMSQTLMRTSGLVEPNPIEFDTMAVVYILRCIVFRISSTWTLCSQHIVLSAEAPSSQHQKVIGLQFLMSS